MTSKSEKRARRKAQQPAVPGSESEPDYKPKAGPGQVIKREMIPAVGGGHSRQKRYRNIAASPMLLAYYRGALAGPGENAPNAPKGQITAEDRKDCAEKFERWWYERMGVSHGDSTIPRISGGGSRSMTEMQQEASEENQVLRERMSSRNFLIVEGFVGIGYSMLDALRYAGVQAHPIGTAFRVREALDDLVCAVTGRQLVPMLVPGKARKGA
jgi:hypothetical protein